MPKKKNTKLKFLSNKKYIFIASIILLAVIGTVTLGFSFASKPKDYRLKQNIEESVISFEEDIPQMLVREKDGRITRESGGKSINITAKGLVYCRTDQDEVKVAQITDQELTQTFTEIESIDIEKDTITQDEPRVNIGNSKTLQISDGNTAGEVRQANEGRSSSINEVEVILEEICAKATETVPANQVPVFVGDKDDVQASLDDDFLSFLFPKVSAGGETVVTIGAPRLVENVEDSHIKKINTERGKNSLPALGKSNCLTTAARTWSRHMASVNKKYHSNFRENIERECGHSWWRRIGENVGRGGDLNGDGQFTAYMNSPTHRANILHPEYQRVGVGAYVQQYPNETVLWTTQLYAACIGTCANK